MGYFFILEGEDDAQADHSLVLLRNEGVHRVGTQQRGWHFVKQNGENHAVACRRYRITITHIDLDGTTCAVQCGQHGDAHALVVCVLSNFSRTDTGLVERNSVLACVSADFLCFLQRFECYIETDLVAKLEAVGDRLGDTEFTYRSAGNVNLLNTLCHCRSRHPHDTQ